MKVSAVTGAHSPSRCSADLTWFGSLRPASPPALSSVSPFRTSALPATLTTKQHYLHPPCTATLTYPCFFLKKEIIKAPTFMSASCFIRSISNDSCCLVLSTSSWVCWVADSILTVSALCQHINAFSVATYSQAVTFNLKRTSLHRSVVCLYLPKQFSMAGHQLCVLLLQLIVPLLSGLWSFYTERWQRYCMHLATFC